MALFQRDIFQPTVFDTQIPTGLFQPGVFQPRIFQAIGREPRNRHGDLPKYIDELDEDEEEAIFGLLAGHVFGQPSVATVPAAAPGARRSTS